VPGNGAVSLPRAAPCSGDFAARAFIPEDRPGFGVCATLRWRERDSNPRSPATGLRFSRPPLIGEELVKDRTTKEPADASQITAVVDFCRDRGLIVGRSGGGRRFGNTITLCPPLVITRAECDRIVDTLDQVLATL
jgi:hypothetical protein